MDRSGFSRTQLQSPCLCHTNIVSNALNRYALLAFIPVELQTMLKHVEPRQIDGGINLIDIGASGRLDRKWRPVQKLVNLVGFDPNQEECERLSLARHNLNSARYLPYAVGGEDQSATLYKTDSIYCYSLLEPKESWLSRFSFGHLFRVNETEPLRTHRFADIPELANLDVDAIKIDTQGLELPILSNAERLLDRAFFVETETGFVENYHGETTYAQIDEFMRDQGFLLFDINVRHRISRDNEFQRCPTGHEQILWCEATWLRDYVAGQNASQLTEMTRAKALKVLLLCALQGCRDFGYELAEGFHDRELITADELGQLGRKATWTLQARPIRDTLWSTLGTVTRLLSRSTRRRLASEVERVVDHPSLVRAMLSRDKRKAA